MNSAATPWASYVAKWAAERSIRRLLLGFVPDPGTRALLALFHELLEPLFGGRESHVVATKLAWWVDELPRIIAGSGRHPLCQALAADSRSRRLDRAQWQAPALAAMHALQRDTATDFMAQRRAAEHLLEPFARLDTWFHFGTGVDFERSRAVASLLFLSQDLSHLPQRLDQACLPLPMQSLARHSLSREDLAGHSAAREAALREYFLDLIQAYKQGDQLAGPLNACWMAEAWHDQRNLQRACRPGREPLQSYLDNRHKLELRSAWVVWSAVRSMRYAVAHSTDAHRGP